MCLIEARTHVLGVLGSEDASLFQKSVAGNYTPLETPRSPRDIPENETYTKIKIDVRKTLAFMVIY